MTDVQSRIVHDGDAIHLDALAGSRAAKDKLANPWNSSVPPSRRMLAAILTIKGEYDMPSHDLLDMASAYAAVHLAGGRRLSTMAVLHVPGDGLSTARQHVHLCVLARQHLPSGWAGEHPDLADTAHRLAGAYPTIVHATRLDPNPLPALLGYVIT